MNKKDCEDIAYILSEYNCPLFIKTKFYSLDERIKDEVGSFDYCKGKDDKVYERMEEIMVEKLGHDWAMKKACTKELTQSVLEQVRREIYKEDYDFIFKK
jgi:hypothetical protein